MEQCIICLTDKMEWDQAGPNETEAEQTSDIWQYENYGQYTFR